MIGYCFSRKNSYSCNDVPSFNENGNVTSFNENGSMTSGISLPPVMFSEAFACRQGGVSVQGVGGLCPGGFSVTETSHYSGRVGGTHPTGMHSC